MISTCSSLCRFIIVYLKSCLNRPIIFHRESSVVSTHFFLGLPLRLTVPSVSVKLTGCRVSPLNVIALVGAPGGSLMMLFNMCTFLSSYTCENLFICLSCSNNSFFLIFSSCFINFSFSNNWFLTNFSSSFANLCFSFISFSCWNNSSFSFSFACLCCSNNSYFANFSCSFASLCCSNLCSFANLSFSLPSFLRSFINGSFLSVCLFFL